MTGSTLVVLVLVAVTAAGLVIWAWTSSARKIPSDEALRHPRPDAAQPLVREESRHHDTPGPADLDTRGGREHNA